MPAHDHALGTNREYLLFPFSIEIKHPDNKKGNQGKTHFGYITWASIFKTLIRTSARFFFGLIFHSANSLAKLATNLFRRLS